MANQGSPDNGDADSIDNEPLESDEVPQRLGVGHHLREMAQDLWGTKPKAQATNSSGTPSSQVKQVVDGLDRAEYLMGAAAAAIAIIVTLLVYFLNRRNSPILLTREDANSFLVAGLIGGVLLILGTVFRRRALLGFAAFIAGFEMASFHENQGVLYIAFGGWLIVRALRKQKQDQTTRVATKRAAPAKTHQPTRVTASKRYTPPRPSRSVPAKKR